MTAASSVSSVSVGLAIAGAVGGFTLEVELDVREGPLVVVGPNGAGKSTLLAMVLGLVRPTRGRIALAGEAVFDSERGLDVPVEQRRIGWVPQGAALFPHLDVRGNVTFAARSAGLPRDEAAASVERALVELHLARLASRRPATLSGGERQRVALARALASKPRALALDEPLASLDVDARTEVRGLLATTLTRLAIPALVVTHDPVDARALGGTIAVLEAGRVMQCGAWSELVARPATPFVASLASAG